jgi:hypothetical protein
MLARADPVWGPAEHPWNTPGTPLEHPWNTLCRSGDAEMPVRTSALILGIVTTPARRAREWIETTIVVSIFLLPLTMLTTMLMRPPGDLKATVRPGAPQSSDVGADGRRPFSPALPEVQTGAGPPIVTTPGPLGMPQQMLEAYQDAAQRLGKSLPGCGLPWPILAAIGKIESNHADNGNIDAQGTTVTAILGPRLSGGPGVAAVPDTDGGKWDGDPEWDRAVGPMQLLPSTWAQFGVDGNDDGVASPHNVHDAGVSAGRYLCSNGGDLRDPRNLNVALLAYNHSDSYVRAVLAWADSYARAVAPTPAPPPNREALAGGLSPLPQDLALPSVPPSPSATPPPTGASPLRPTNATPPPSPSATPLASPSAMPPPSTNDVPSSPAPPTSTVAPSAEGCVPLPVTPQMQLCTGPTARPESPSGTAPPLTTPAVPPASPFCKASDSVAISRSMEG